MQRLLERGLRRHATALKEAGAVTVSIIASVNDAREAVDAVPGRREFAQYSVDEYVGTAETFDWIVAEQDLFFNGKKLEPADGWEIWHKLDDGSTAVYKARPEAGTRAYDVVDQLGLMYRIHTKLDRIEPAP